MTNHATNENHDTELLEQGRACLKADRWSEALRISERLFERLGRTPRTLLFASEVHFQRGNFMESDRLAEECLQAYPDEIGGGVLRCRALYALGRHDEARKLALSLADKDLAFDSHRQIVTSVLLWCLEPEAAYPLCKQSIALDPDNASAHHGLALICRAMGDVDETEEAANAAIRLDPHDYEMIQLRSSLRTMTPERNNTAELEALLAGGCRDWQGTVKVAYALAKEKEDIGDYESAFHFLKTGASLQRSAFRQARPCSKNPASHFPDRSVAEF